MIKCVKKIFSVLTGMLFPPRCVFCRKAIKSFGICDDCNEKLPYTNGVKIKPPQFIDKVYAPLYYTGNVRKAILRYKFKRITAYTKPLCEMIVKSYGEKIRASSIDFITWAPISRARFRTRGFDQSECIARYLSKALSIPVVSTLKKVRNTPKQSQMKDSSARRANVSGAYKTVNDEKIALKNILIIDDVLTTGSTLSECARMLRTAGALSVCAAVVAKTKKSN